jgi:hypothetical protein
MRIPRRVLGLLWTLAAAVPVAIPAEAHADSGAFTVSAPGRSSRPESRPSLGEVRIGLGESVLRDCKTAFLAPSNFQVGLDFRIALIDEEAVRRSDGQSVRRFHWARAPPQLT